MSRVVIIGAGSFGRELHGWIDTSPRWRSLHDVSEVVFVADGVGSPLLRGSMIAGIADYAPRLDDLVLCAVGDPTGRRDVVERLERRGIGFTTFVHDAAIVGPNVQIGEGGIICPRVVLTCDISLDAQVHINVGCTVGHDGSIGAFTTLSVACTLAGGVTVEADAFLATGVTVIPGRRIGQGSYVGAGSVVIRNVRPHVTVFGNPATKIGDRS